MLIVEKRHQATVNSLGNAKWQFSFKLFSLESVAINELPKSELLLASGISFPNHVTHGNSEGSFTSRGSCAWCYSNVVINNYSQKNCKLLIIYKHFRFRKDEFQSHFYYK